MESFTKRLDEIRSMMDADSHRRRVLLLCQQHEPRQFEEYSSSGSFRRFEKFESSTYSEVLKAIDLSNNNKPVVIKIMRALSKSIIISLPSIITRGCQAYNDILNELVVTQALSQLHEGVLSDGETNALYRTHFFCLIHEIKVVTGNLERAMTKSRMSTVKKVKENEYDTDSNGTAPLSTIGVVKTSSTVLSSQLSPTGLVTEESSELEPLESINVATRELKLDDTSETGKKQQKNNDQYILKEKNGAKDKEGQEEEEKEIDAQKYDEDQQPKISKEDELIALPEEERMLMEALPQEYVVSVMQHDGQPLWWMMTHKKLSAEQLSSVLVQVIVGLAIAENVYMYEHRDLHVSNILIKATKDEHIPFVLDGERYKIVSYGVKATIIDATFSRLTHNGKVYYRDLTSTLRAYGSKKTPTKMSLQNRSYRQMVRITRNKWQDFAPKTNLIWLTYLCETLMKNEILKNNPSLHAEIRMIRDHTLASKTTLELLGHFPFQKEKSSNRPQISSAQSRSGKQKPR